MIWRNNFPIIFTKRKLDWEVQLWPNHNRKYIYHNKIKQKKFYMLDNDILGNLTEKSVT